MADTTGLGVVLSVVSHHDAVSNFIGSGVETVSGVRCGDEQMNIRDKHSRSAMNRMWLPVGWIFFRPVSIGYGWI